ncbi:hypothetical protein NQ317_019193 [Molorchus minor]|uniref:DUF5641 domain-containing protein n=1 Tax=Molorchus minor TaxID=1323400 RepID=A0ABQ9IPV4_9CUCU|nr:hypothetical protein NQ317_019193 [Molorchus minor]
MLSIPEPSTGDISDNRLSQYQLLQRLYEHFWTRWSREYLNELQRRQCWKKTQGSLQLGQLVLIKDNNLPPSRWRLGRVLQFIYGKDGTPRVASIRTTDGIISRAVVRLCPLPVVNEAFQGRGHVPYSTSERENRVAKPQPTSSKKTVHLQTSESHVQK